MNNTLIELGLLPAPPQTNLRWFYLSRNTNSWTPCRGYDGGAADATKYARYGYQIKAAQEQE